jgi:hypothetical protein
LAGGKEGFEALSKGAAFGIVGGGWHFLRLSAGLI